MKNKPLFRITYETVNFWSVRIGDAAYRGFLPRSGNVPLYRNHMPKNPALFSLRQALEMMQPGGSAPIEADSSPCNVPRWLTCQISGDSDDPISSLSLHLENSGVSDASARRIARLFGVKLENR